ncbi:YciI family protein [Mesorhizobium xinjiangense]|uniref:YciI family protein n=1 Tax=Mesorhizobium xinjiangense TaxID=2678685 RepID=UPI0012ED8471|nr:YciI family protein [Mesorhizobium xinjiangense]
MSDADDLKSVPAAGVKEASKAMLQMQLYAIFTTPTDGLGAVFANLEEHLKFQVELERKGIMFAAGPMWTDDEQSWEGEGLVVIRAASREAAIEIARADPMHRSGARNFKVRPWMINEGSLTLRFDFSTQAFGMS